MVSLRTSRTPSHAKPLLLTTSHSLVDGSKEGVEDMEGEGRGGQPPLKPPFVPVSSRTSSGGGEW